MRVALSSDPQYYVQSQDDTFDNHEFYNEIHATLLSPDFRDELAAIITWWNE